MEKAAGVRVLVRVRNQLKIIRNKGTLSLRHHREPRLLE